MPEPPSPFIDAALQFATLRIEITHAIELEEEKAGVKEVLSKKDEATEVFERGGTGIWAVSRSMMLILTIQREEAREGIAEWERSDANIQLQRSGQQSNCRGAPTFFPDLWPRQHQTLVLNGMPTLPERICPKPPVTSMEGPRRKTLAALSFAGAKATFSTTARKRLTRREVLNCLYAVSHSADLVSFSLLSHPHSSLILIPPL